MVRSYAQQRADARATVAVLTGALIVATCAVAVLGVLLVARPAQARFTPATLERTAYAKCGAYDVFVVGHDMPSAHDARLAAFSYLDQGCEVGRGDGDA